MSAPRPAALITLTVDGPVEVRRGLAVSLVDPAAAPADVPSFDTAAFNDHEAIFALLKENGLPMPGPNDEPVVMLVARQGRTVIGCVGYERYGTRALLRSLAVHPSARGRGVGALLVAAVCERLAGEGVREVVLLTLTAKDFFARHGFEVFERSAIPPDIRRSPELTGIACACAVCMRRLLRAR
jgi:amino-acid N-acetyltransferase